MDCSPAASDSTVVQRGNLLLVEARLQGGAPWGFTLKGGLEYGEPLIISKVEEDGKAGLLQYPLLVGDEVVVINGVELSGFRQEAISLVKGSYKILHLTVRREGCASPCCSETRPLTLSSGQRVRKDRCTGGVQLRIKQRRNEPGSRPHSWHSTKLGEGPLDPDSMMQISQGAVGPPWHQSYHSSASTTDLSYEAGFLRKSPDQYSSRGSMESLDQNHPAYSSCNQLSASKSSSSIDHLHSKRDSAYSSFSTSSSIPEYLAAAPSFSKERSFSMESVPQNRITEGMQQADIRYVRTVYDSQQGVSEEHDVSSTAVQRTNESRAQSRSGSSQGGSCHHANRSSTSSSSSSSGGTSTSHRHSVGPELGPTHNHNSYENLKGAPAPPLRSDSYAAIRNHERPNSWSSLEQARTLRTLHKGSWHHSSGSVASGKSSFGLEGQLHTVIEKSPESSPTIKPKQSFPSASQSGRAMLPTGVYPVPQAEPHFAQIPTNNPSSSSVYPALSKESKHIPKRDPSGLSETGIMAVVENGYQSIASYSTTVQPNASAQPKQSNQVQDDLQAKCGFYRSHLQPQGYMPSAPSLGQERRDPFTPVQPRGDRPRYSHGMDIMETYRQPREEEISRGPEQNVHIQSVHTSVAQGQVSQPHRVNTAQVQAGDQRISSSVRLNSDSIPYQQTDQDLDHPLTRLENALAEVQRCSSPQSTTSQSSYQSERSMSVLEKVSHFERQQTKPRSHSSLSSYSSASRPRQAVRSAKSPSCGLEDLQNSFPQERCRSASLMARVEGSMEMQDLRPRYGSSDLAQHRKPYDLHRSKSSFQLGEENDKDLHRSKSTFQLGEEDGRDIPWKDDVQDILGTVQDTSFNRAYRDSIKDAQSKVLRSTSFRRRDLNVNPPPVPVKHMSLERKGPKTSPKPTISPHTPKERHVVPVEAADRMVPPDLPTVPPVGHPVMRICGRKRLTMEQKKLSYSEPENMHEVGVSDQESGSSQRKASQQFMFPETSVADRRRMFELAASHGAGLKAATSRPDLKQMQQDALAEYVERKTGRRLDGRPNRPLSAYMQSASSSSMDTQSLTSSPSLCSLQEPGPESMSVINLQPSTLTANKLRSYYPNRGTQTQPQQEIYHPAYRPQGQTTEPQKPEKGLERPASFQAPASALEHFHTDSVSQSINAFFERGVPARCSGKSASAEDLLEHTEDRPVTQHFRSRSSPVVENYDQDFLARDLTLFGIVSKEPPNCRAAGGVALAHWGRGQVHADIPKQPDTPVIRRERQRLSDRPRAHSATGLAASVGLPCPLSPPGPAGQPECRPNLDAISFPCVVLESPKRSFGAPETSDEASETSGAAKETSTQRMAALKITCDLSTSHPEDKAAGSSLSEPTPQPIHFGPATVPKSPAFPAKSLPSLRISESNIQFSPLPAMSKEDDEVFLATPSTLPPPLPIRETEILTEDLLLFPPPPTKEEAQDHMAPQEPQCVNSISNYRPVAPTRQDMEEHLQDLQSLPVTSDPNSTLIGGSMTSNGETVAQCPEASSTEESEEAPESLDLDWPPLARRERSAVEVHVEVLARELVHRDEALAPLLETWVGTSTLDLLEDLFLSHASSPRQQRSDSPSCPGDRVTIALGVAGNSHEKAFQGRTETNLDEEESYLNHKKGELLRTLTESVAALRAERAGLAEQERCCVALGGATEALVEQRCKANERDKYRVFVGDQEKIVNLLLSLSGRLARVENALNALGEHPDQDGTEERASLLQKRQQLLSQQEDARELKENLDRRERVVLDFLAGYLSRAQLHDHQRYVRARPTLLIRQRRLDELIRRGEEQLQRLGQSVPPELHPPGLDPASSPQGANLLAPTPRPTTVTSL